MAEAWAVTFLGAYLGKTRKPQPQISEPLRKAMPTHRALSWSRPRNHRRSQVTGASQRKNIPMSLYNQFKQWCDRLYPLLSFELLIPALALVAIFGANFLAAHSPKATAQVCAIEHCDCHIDRNYCISWCAKDGSKLGPCCRLHCVSLLKNSGAK